MPQPCYCGPATVPVVCVERITELIKARDFSPMAILELSGHAGAVWAYISAKIVGGPEVMSITPEDERLNAAVLKLVDAVLGVEKERPKAIPGFIIDVIVSQILQALIERMKDAKFWQDLVSKALELIEKLK